MPQPKPPHAPPLRRAWIAALVFLACFALLAVPTSRGPYPAGALAWPAPSPVLEGDEYGHIEGAERFFRAFFLERDFGSAIWREPLQSYGLYEPRMTHYTLGSIFRLSCVLGDAPPSCTPRPWAGRLDVAPSCSAAQVQTMKLMVALLAAAAVTLIFLFSWAEVGLPGALVVALLLAINPFTRGVATSLVREIPVLVYSAAALLALRSLERRLSRGIPWPALLGFAVFAALTVSCGLYGFPVYMVLLAILALRLRQAPARCVLVLVVVGAVGALVFFGHNPLLWSDPVGGLRTLTTGHLDYDNAGDKVLEPRLLSYLFSYPFLLLRWARLGLMNSLPPLQGWSWAVVGVGWALCAWSLWGARRLPSRIPLLWLVASFLWIGFIVVSRPQFRLSAKLFVLPAVPVVWLVGLRIGLALRALMARWRGAQNGM